MPLLCVWCRQPPNLRRPVCKASLCACSLKRQPWRRLGAFCLQLVLHSFPLVFLSCYYAKSHIDRDPLAHVIGLHSSLAMPDRGVGLKAQGPTERSTPRQAANLRAGSHGQGSRDICLLSQPPVAAVRDQNDTAEWPRNCWFNHLKGMKVWCFLAWFWVSSQCSLYMLYWYIHISYHINFPHWLTKKK